MVRIRRIYSNSQLYSTGLLVVAIAAAAATDAVVVVADIFYDHNI